MGSSISKEAPAVDVVTRLAIIYTLKLWRDARFRGIRLPAISFVMTYVWCVLKGGPFHSLLWTLTGFCSAPNPTTHGSVARGFEPVREVFESSISDGMERAAQFVVYVKGKKVIDLWGSQSYMDHYDNSTLQIVMSSTKNFAALAIAMLVRRGHLDYMAPVAQYWPEFGNHGRAHLTVADVMRHEAGCAALKKPLVYDDLVDPAKVAKRIAESPPLDPIKNEPVRSYHGITRGFLINELVCRTDPAGRTVGKFVEDEIASVLKIQMLIGENKGLQTQVNADGGIRDSTTLSNRYRKVQAQPHRSLNRNESDSYMVLKLVARALAGGSFGLVPLSSHLTRCLKDMPNIDAPSNKMFAAVDWRTFYDDDFPLPFIDSLLAQVAPPLFFTSADRFHAPKATQVEIPSANGLSNARSLGLVAAAMVSDAGVLAKSHHNQLPEEDGTAEEKVVSFKEEELLREIRESAKLAMEAPVNRWDNVINAETSFTQGGYNLFGEVFDNEDWPKSIQGFFGWGGFGGSMMAWHPEHEVAIAYVMNGNMRTSFFGFDDPRCIKLMDALQECLAAEQ
jgi:CubicO group peptidase (beta-lactamase class C family)